MSGLFSQKQAARHVISSASFQQFNSTQKRKAGRFPRPWLVYDFTAIPWMSISCPEWDVCGVGRNTNLLNEYSLWPIQSKSHAGVIWGLVQPTYTILFIVFRRGQDNEESLLTSPPHTHTSLWIWFTHCWGACTIYCLIFTQNAKPSLAFILYLLLQLVLYLLLPIPILLLA